MVVGCIFLAVLEHQKDLHHKGSKNKMGKNPKRTSSTPNFAMGPMNLGFSRLDESRGNTAFGPSLPEKI